MDGRAPCSVPPSTGCLGRFGQDAVVDGEAEPDRWQRFDRAGSRNGWQDMAASAERQHDPALRERLASGGSICGKFCPIMMDKFRLSIKDNHELQNTRTHDVQHLWTL
ncbi:hypothetical protein G6038_28215 [Rhodococcus sp. 14C212]|uniref:hypothetical protein n=1 Tax=Rhodococcus sp. 14C212 TaxID=2711209 RepID=UPI0013EC957F|nr:hypothetical protein [Rhodococcus sp. 14C212]NGP09291.1 hypothetical protein [Rhodococcus sp. 14C212]